MLILQDTPPTPSLLTKVTCLWGTEMIIPSGHISLPSPKAEVTCLWRDCSSQQGIINEYSLDGSLRASLDNVKWGEVPLNCPFPAILLHGWDKRRGNLQTIKRQDSLPFLGHRALGSLLWEVCYCSLNKTCFLHLAQHFSGVQTSTSREKELTGNQLAGNITITTKINTLFS